MATGVIISTRAKLAYEELMKDKKYRSVTFMISNREIVVDCLGGRYVQYEQFVDALQKGGALECRYGLYDFDSKCVLIFWCPETARMSQKMLYTSSFEALRLSLPGIQKSIVATNLSGLSRDRVEN